jgi:hypothetical protein
MNTYLTTYWSSSSPATALFGRLAISFLHRKKRFTSFPSPAGMSLTKLPLGRNNSVMPSLFPPRESLVVTSRLGTGNSRTFFYGVIVARFFILFGNRIFCKNFSCIPAHLQKISEKFSPSETIKTFSCPYYLLTRTTFSPLYKISSEFFSHITNWTNRL